MNHDGHSGQLLDHTLLRLSPDVFFHPVWRHFVGTKAPGSPDLIKSLLRAVEEAQTKGDLNCACQVLLMCAALLSRSGAHAAALQSAQQALALAELHKLLQIVWWAAWGASAICAQQGLYTQAAEHLKYLHARLSEQGEWILAGVVDVVQQALPNQAAASADAGTSLSADSALIPALEHLLRWGVSAPTTTTRVDRATGQGERYGYAPRSISHSADFGQRLQSLWQTIKRIAKGELRLKWVETNGSAPLPHPEESNALQPIPPVIVTALAPAPMLPPLDQSPALKQQPELDQSSTSAEDQEPIAPQPLAPDRLEPAAESPAPASMTGHPPWPAVIGEPETPAVPVLPAAAQRAPESYTIAIYCLGPFRVYQYHQLIEEWTGLRGQAVLKYLVAHRGTPIAKDVLMDVFWLDADPEAARRNLHQAIYSLRQTLRRRDPDVQHIQFENNQYLLNPALSVWIDVEEFETHFQSGRRLEAAGQLAAAMVDYGTAEALYQGDFLEEDLFDDWPRPQREQLRTTYLDIADRLSEYYRQQGQYSAGIALCQKILTLDHCVEEAHRRLMRCYLAQGQRHMAIRQYHICVQALAKELDVAPAVETRSLYASISANS